MGIRIDGATDLINASDGSLTIEGQSINSTGIMTASGGVKVGTAATIHSTGQFNIGVAATIFANGNAAFAGVTTTSSLVSSGAISGTTGTFSADTSLSIADKIVHTGDTDTAIRFPGNDIFTIETGGSERVRVDSAGLKITDKLLHSGDIDTFLEFGTDTITLDTAGSERLRIRNDGRVSIASSLAVTGVCTAVAFFPSAGQLSNRNLIINGAMTVAQRGTSEASTGYKTCDRWQLGGSWPGSAITQAQVDVSYTSIPYDKGFRKAFKITNSNQGSVATSSNIEITYSWEGQDIAGSGWNYVATSGDDSKITLSFWIKSSVAQTFYGYFRTFEGTDMKYSFPIVCSSTDWEYKTVTVGGEGNMASNINNSFRMDNSKDLVLRIVPFYGTDYTDSGAVNNAWQNYSSATITPEYATTWMLTNASTMEITGVQLEVGPVATPFEHRSYGEELRRCLRYYWQVNNDKYRRVGGYKRSDSNVHWEIQSPVPMRDTPSPTLSDGGIFTDFNSNFGSTQSSPQISEWDVNIGKGLLVVSSNYAPTHVFIPSWEGYQLQLSSEL